MTTPETLSKHSFLLSAVFLFLIVLISGGMSIYVLSDPQLRSISRLAQVAYYVDQLYQDEIDWDQAAESAVNAMFDRLDRYSGYIDPDRWNRVQEEFSGSYSGIGVTVSPHDDGLLIMSVREDGPAHAVGLLSGDVIIAVDSLNIGGMDIQESTGHLRGPANTDVSLTVFRPVDEDTLDFVVTRKEIDFVHIPFAGYTPDTLVYIRLADFDAGVSRDLRDALDSLLDRDTIHPRGLILDLRGNPGGLLNEAFATADLFLADGQLIVGTDGRSRWDEYRYKSSGRDVTNGLPMAVLVDRGSASAAEIVAGSLKQLQRATLVGDTTFGKGLVQGYTRLANGGAVRLTISRYFLEGGVYLNEFDTALIEAGHGLAPDRVISFVERDAFPRALERSLLLQAFANRHQDEIVGADDDFALADAWITRFQQFAAEKEFIYESETTEHLKALTDLAALNHSTQLHRAVRQMLEDSRRLDQEQFRHYGSYIKMRLKQIAYERASGVYAAYARAVVPARPDIQEAARILKEQP